MTTRPEESAIKPEPCAVTSFPLLSIKTTAGRILFLISGSDNSNVSDAKEREVVGQINAAINKHNRAFDLN